MSVDLLANPRVKTERGSSLENRVSALENYVTLLLGSIDIADGAITTSKILNGAVAELKIASGAVTAAKTAVAGLNSSTGNVSANHIIAGMIQSGAVTTSKIYAGAITSDKITVSTLSAISANIGSVTAGTITGVTITGGTIRTATSGARVQLDSSNYLQAYDASGLRMKLTTDRLNFYDESSVLSGYIIAEGAATVMAGNDLFLDYTRVFGPTRFLGTNIELTGYIDVSGNINFLSTQYIRWGTSNQYTLRHDGSDFAFNDGITAAGSLKSTAGSIDQQSTVGRVRQYLCGLRSRAEPGSPASGEVYIYYNSSNNNLEVKFSDGAIFILANN